ncbi:Uncharacterized protein HZ326_24685 [Fusarium oxysporum f. sp. albedinis]|nr:Uncharacterized protein HZ326_24685 [Fusarium oxysporum f. sp. albedinis]
MFGGSCLKFFERGAAIFNNINTFLRKLTRTSLMSVNTFKSSRLQSARIPSDYDSPCDSYGFQESSGDLERERTS